MLTKAEALEVLAYIALERPVLGAEVVAIREYVEASQEPAPPAEPAPAEPVADVVADPQP